MRFRPCIDIHNGTVKQIVGGSLTDQGDQAEENFAATQGAEYFARLYQKDQLTGGHVIMLNSKTSPYYEQTKAQALRALQTYPEGLQIGGGITEQNAMEFLAAGASHVIVTSYAFSDGEIQWEHMKKLRDAVGKEHVVLDLSCRKKDGVYYIVTNRWQTFTNVQLSTELLEELAEYCDEFLVHGVDVEGHAAGIDAELAKLLGSYEGNPVTYAGGIGSMENLEEFAEISEGNLDFTIGSALDLFGGNMQYDVVKNFGCAERNRGE